MMYLVVGVGVMIGLLAIIAKAVINFNELDEKEHPMDSLKEKRKKENKCIFRKSKKGEIAIRVKSDIQ